VKIRASLALVAAIGFWGATPDAHGQHGGAGGLGALSGFAHMGTGGAVSGSFYGFGGYAVSGGFGGYGMGTYGFNGWTQGSPYGGYYNPMMMNQAGMMGNGFPGAMNMNMNMGQNGMPNNAGAGMAGNARTNLLAGEVPNGATVNPNANGNAKASSRPGTAAKSKATKSRTKTTRKR
jgi:hypothetical protein